jgi:GntR family transcriptional regulator
MTATSALPKYIRISEMLIRDIAAGHLADGAKLAPERDMAADLGISVGTLRKALADMQKKGYLERVQGSGNYVRTQADARSIYAFFRLERLRGGGLPRAQVLSVDRLPKPAGAPVIGEGQEGHRIRRRRWLDDDVIALEEIWLDGRFCDRITTTDLSESLYLFYRLRLDLLIATVEDRIGCAALPDWPEADFHLPPGATVGYIERVGRDGNGTAAEYSRTWFDTDRARYVSRIGRG